MLDSRFSRLACGAKFELLNSVITSQKKKTGVIAPKRFVQRLKKQNELFRSYMHQKMMLKATILPIPDHVKKP
ncbi:hypothetical protein K1719_024003 [Acacia pycnantha]|nr:hypothetical protein K1719_024003 [Acacia pycnantha]